MTWRVEAFPATQGMEATNEPPNPALDFLILALRKAEELKQGLEPKSEPKSQEDMAVQPLEGPRHDRAWAITKIEEEEKEEKAQG